MSHASVAAHDREATLVRAGRATPARFKALPDKLEDEQLDQLAAQWRRVTAKLTEAQRDVSRLEAARAKAIRDDELAHAEAMLNGRKDPGHVHEDEVTPKLEAAQRTLGNVGRREGGYAGALALAEQQLIDAIDARRDEYTAAMLHRERLARDDFRSRLADAREAVGRVRHFRALRWWAQGFPAQKRAQMFLEPPLTLSFDTAEPTLEQVLDALAAL